MLSEVQEVKMTPALEQLIATRKKKVINDVETDFANLRESGGDTKGMLSTMATSGQHKKSSKSNQFSMNIN